MMLPSFSLSPELGRTLLLSAAVLISAINAALWWRSFWNAPSIDRGLLLGSWSALFFGVVVDVIAGPPGALLLLRLCNWGICVVLGMLLGWWVGRQQSGTPKT